MDCANYRLNMLPYLKHELSTKETKRLIEHVAGCRSCKEELKIQFLVVEGMRRLEYGETFNLAQDYEKSLKTVLHECNVIEQTQRLVYWVFYLGCILVISFLVKGILL